MPKPKMYRITSEDHVYLGGKDQVNKLPDPFKDLFIKALKQAAEGKTPTPFSVPPKTLTDAGFVTEEEFLAGQEGELEDEELEEEVEGETIEETTPQARLTLKRARSAISQGNKSFVDILADKIAERVLERLLK